MKYKEGTTRQQIIEDGWSRGFRPIQIFHELTEQGLTLDIKTIHRKLKQLDKKYELSQNLQE